MAVPWDRSAPIMHSHGRGVTLDESCPRYVAPLLQGRLMIDLDARATALSCSQAICVGLCVGHVRTSVVDSSYTASHCRPLLTLPPSQSRGYMYISLTWRGKGGAGLKAYSRTFSAACRSQGNVFRRVTPIFEPIFLRGL